MNRKQLIEFSRPSFYRVIGSFVLCIPLPIFSAVAKVIGTISLEDAISNMQNINIDTSAIVFMAVVFVILLKPLYLLDILFKLVREDEIEIISKAKQPKREDSFYVYNAHKGNSNKKRKLKFSRVCTTSIGLHARGSIFSHEVMTENPLVIGEKYAVSYLLNSKWCISAVKIDYFSL